MVSVGTLVMVSQGDSPGSLIDEINCWNKFKLLSRDATGGAEAGPVSWCGVKRVGKVVLNFFSPNVRAEYGVESMKTLDRMKVPVSFTIMLFIQPRRKVRSSWMAGLARFSRFLIHLYMVMASRSASKPL